VSTRENGHEFSSIVDAIRTDVCVQHLPEGQHFSSTLAAKIKIEEMMKLIFLL